MILVVKFSWILEWDKGEDMKILEKAGRKKKEQMLEIKQNRICQHP